MTLRDEEQAEAEAEEDVQPVDSEGRATALRLLSLSSPHTRAFHLSWLSLSACFFAAFASPPLLPAIRPALRILPAHLSAASSAALLSALLSRLLLGPACHLLPSRLALAAVSLLSALPLPFIAAVAASPADYVALRAVSGVSLAAFVANQHWIAAAFAPEVVGAAAALAAGWANAGAAAAQLVMPRAFELLRGRLGFTADAAWRLAFVVPAALQVATALAVVFLADDDIPGNKNKKSKKEEELEGSGSFWEVLEDGLGNYRGWVLALTYGYCYGAELIMENIAARYFYEKFGLDMGSAGAAAAFFGAMNVVARPAGGMASDELGRRFGMRGRLWGLWAAQTVAGMLCILLGRMGRWSSSSVAATVAVMVVFALFLQAASGLTFGVVPFVSRRSLGVISGMTGSGGVVGAMTMQLLFFSGSKYAIETGISCMGAMIVVCTLPIALIRFPESGGMFCGPRSSSSAARDGDYGVEDEYLQLLLK